MKVTLRGGIVLAAIVVLGAFFRLYNTTWDGGHYLHPDERFLTMVGTAMRVPASFGEYMDPARSPFNPANIGYTFYVYGLFPLTLNTALALFFNMHNYGEYGLLGRVFSGIVDVATLAVVYAMARFIARKHKLPAVYPLAAAFFYATAVLPIQLSHFFTTDIFLSFFVTAALYLLTRFSYGGSFWHAPAAGALFGLAVASKVSAVYILPLFGLLVCAGGLAACIHKLPAGPAARKLRLILGRCRNPDILLRLFAALAAFGVACYTTLRIGSPYYFQNPSFFSPQLSELFLSNIEQLRSFDSREGFFPPAIQWMSKPFWFLAQNTFFFGLGMAHTIAALAGLYVLLFKKRHLIPTLIAVWAAAFFVYQSVSFVKAMRYVIYLYPIFALWAAYAAASLSTVKLTKARFPVFLPLLFAGLMIWPLMFFNIYANEHSRVEASRWIYDNIPGGSIILTEHWDDGLPLYLPGSVFNYRGEQLEIFIPDSPEKFAKIEKQMSAADYYIMTSNRGWGSIPTVPDKYPIMSKWYEQLFAGEKGYRIVHVVERYPSLEWLGIPIRFPDDWADETFTVYDHPKVIIMKNMNTSSGVLPELDKQL